MAMFEKILKRVLLAAVSLFAIITITFFLMKSWSPNTVWINR